MWGVRRPCTRSNRCDLLTNIHHVIGNTLAPRSAVDHVALVQLIVCDIQASGTTSSILSSGRREGLVRSQKGSKSREPVAMDTKGLIVDVREKRKTAGLYAGAGRSVTLKGVRQVR